MILFSQTLAGIKILELNLEKGKVSTVKVDMGERDLYQKELDTYNAYNTRGPNMEGKLPIGPVASVSKSSIEAALEPNKTDYIFFVADKNGKLYFTKTSSEHNRIISELKENGLWFEY